MVHEDDAAATDSTPAGGIREVKSAARTVKLLELLAAHRYEPVRVRELSDAMNAPRSSIYALLRTLVDHGWVRTDSTGSFYSIGIQALLAGTTYLDVDPVLRIVQSHIDDLSTELDETVHYGRLEGTDIVYLATHESSQYLRPFSRIGRRLPAFSTALGKALLADRLDNSGDELLTRHLPSTLEALTPHTVVDYNKLKDDLIETRARGYALDREESVPGLTCIAVPLRFGGLSFDAISCALPTERLRPGRLPEVVAAMRNAKLAIERMAPLTGAYNQTWC